MNAKLIAVISILTSGTLAGYITGNHFSPDSSKPATAHCYLAVYGVWQHVDDTHGRITLRAGDWTYAYTSGDKTIDVHELPPNQIAKSGMPHREMDKDFDRLVGLTAAGSSSAGVLAAVMSSPIAREGVTHYTNGEKAGIVLITLGSFGVGYMLGHHDLPDTNDAKFHETLVSDVSTWSDFEKAWRDEYDVAVSKQVEATLQTRSLIGFDPLNYEQVTSGPCAPRDPALLGVFSPLGASGSLTALHPEICAQVRLDKRVNDAEKKKQASMPTSFLYPGLGSNSILSHALTEPSKPFSIKKLGKLPAFQPLEGPQPLAPAPNGQAK